MKIKILLLFLGLFLIATNADARDGERREGFVKKLLEQRGENRARDRGSDKGLYLKGKGESVRKTLNGRDYIVYLPPELPPSGSVPLVIALHGGFGNAKHLQNYLGLDAYADKHGFIVAYLNGTAVSPKLPSKMQGWNAGDCCGYPSKTKVDDVGFIEDVINALVQDYGVDRARIYGTGHSNGAMMSIRIACETNLYAGVAAYSGALQMDIDFCAGARGTKVVNIHGSQDKNLPPEGGYTTEGFNKRTKYKPQSYAQDVFDRSDGAYELIMLEGAGHRPETLNAKLWETEGLSLPQKIMQELGLD